ncbi:MAG TPA: tRNA pseudouridine(38-40) synthase TruA [Xanthomonadales bacterium]|nr:tRNA pseudouridine(38-40) synthase TruA [Xanthomonadales bacterium]
MRYALGLEYDGSAFLGWQIQRQEPTVQGCLERAVAIVADHEVRVNCCGRTDTGVHACCQVAHFDTHSMRDERSWVLGINSHLPAGISVLWVREVDEDFHARFSAYARSYQYRILNRWIRPALESSYLCWYRKPLDTERMHESAQVLVGEHDFSAFRAAGCQANHAVREIHAITVQRSGNRVMLDITANGFLYHMVRNIAGNLLAIGNGEYEAEWLKGLLDGKDRTLAAPTAPAAGLYFMGARYPEKYALPSAAIDFPTWQNH